MNWVFTTYDGSIIPHACHPRAAKARITDILTRYGESPATVTRHRTVALDLGGMIRVGSEWLTIPLGFDRDVAVLAVQCRRVTEELRDTKPVLLNGKKWIRIGSHPGRLIYMSLNDKKKIMIFLSKMPDLDTAHLTEMHGVMSKANARVFGHDTRMQ